ncbi:hypothetical protein LQ564_22055 [Massilia sp. G4R7]|uniref:Uncharacterized protein n=1 Tax=Massilia phyllostachyos TaxID=2898585 RepID=A0ABS8QB69_9BURK|nr:hypothetical protein [Massilia phyllostachyos]MCD2518989.1 hypothetical protein [Massilia phyllostachyos]
MTPAPEYGDPQWRFDAVDLRAGLGIALWRAPRGAAHEAPGDHAPALFFSPPHFQPEPLVNAAVALAACRGAFAPGLRLDDGDTEAAFATQEEAGEFLRRAYVGAAAGDGGDGGGPGPVPAPAAGAGGPFEPVHLPDSPIVATLAQHAEVFRSAAGRTLQRESFLFSWGDHTLEHDERWIGKPAAQPGDVAALCAAALAIIEEMLRRMPPLHDAGAWLTWYEDWRELATMLVGVGVAEQLLAEPQRDRLEKVLLRSPLMRGDDGRDAWRVRLGQLFLFGPAIPQPATSEELWSALTDLDWIVHRWSDAWLFPLAVRLDDPLDTLSRLPLPPRLQALLPQDVGSQASLYHLLNLMVAEPQAACSQAEDLPFACCLLLFAAACVATAPTSPQNVPMLRLQAHGRSAERARRAAEQGHAWLIEHLPQRVFATGHEALIATAKSLRYRAPAPDA